MNDDDREQIEKWARILELEARALQLDARTMVDRVVAQTFMELRDTFAQLEREMK